MKSIMVDSFYHAILLLENHESMDVGPNFNLQYIIQLKEFVEISNWNRIWSRNLIQQAYFINCAHLSI